MSVENVLLGVVATLILVTIVGGIYGLVVYRRERREKMRWASSNGWAYTKHERYLPQQFGRPLESSGRADDIYRKDADGVNLIVFTLTLGHGSTSRTHLVGRELQADLPVMTLEPSRVSDGTVMKLVDKVLRDGEHPLDISDPYWSVSVPDAEDDDAVRRVLSAETMQFVGRDEVVNLREQIMFAGSYVFMTNRGASEPHATWQERVDTRLWVLGELGRLLST